MAGHETVALSTVAVPQHVQRSGPYASNGLNEFERLSLKPMVKTCKNVKDVSTIWFELGHTWMSLEQLSVHATQVSTTLRLKLFSSGQISSPSCAAASAAASASSPSRPSRPSKPIKMPKLPQSLWSSRSPCTRLHFQLSRGWKNAHH